MGFKIDLTLDCVDAERLAEFYKAAFGYLDEPPPAPFATRQEWLAQFEDEDDGGGGAWLYDPDGVAPRLCLLDVPEPKTAKNRLHMDIRASAAGPPERRWELVSAEVDRLVGLGARRVTEFAGHHVVMADPEGNEFCVA
ncbi:VOC family protein [Actinokineospora diospyrosa]|uniref:Glyoxalase-like domain-containing protein n=1 Tax=Actinokineospora diospyrosa TaxID=103728 RepID=A0ABT1IFB0_9PSEU|nr:VOC family protein [Actinokineospora diospyrosa]MCP2271249.1 hypothetical protein [Actinokineospora diospyrosa]